VLGPASRGWPVALESQVRTPTHRFRPRRAGFSQASRTTSQMAGGRRRDFLGRPPAGVAGQTPRQGVRLAFRLSFFFRELKFWALAWGQNLEVARVYSTLKTAFPAATYLS
jgi:hypothetical protein